MSKQTGVLIAATVVFVLGILVLSSSDTKSGTQNLGPQQDNMHAQQPTDSTLFDSLVGKKAPEFNLVGYDGKNYSLSNLKGKNVVLFFSEGLMCYPACWDQMAALGKDTRFAGKNAVVLTIVNDRKEDWKQAIDKMPDLASATVLFDTDRSASIAYGVLNLPSSMHKGQLAGHTYIIVDKEGVVRFTLDDPNMAIRNDELINQISKLK